MRACSRWAVLQFSYSGTCSTPADSRYVWLAQPLGIVPWAFAQLRHDHPPMFEAMAGRGMQLLPLSEQAGGINDRSMAMCIWVSKATCTQPYSRSLEIMRDAISWPRD